MIKNFFRWVKSVIRREPLVNYDGDICKSIGHYYYTINSYKGKAGSAKTSDKHMDGFIDLLESLAPEGYDVRKKHKAIVKGAFLNKRWDITYGKNNTVKKALECKSIVLSKTGKHLTSRAEEAIGVATDLRRANKGIKLNYFLIVEDDQKEGSSELAEKLAKIASFCKYLEKDLKLYDNVFCIAFDPLRNYKYVYSDFNTFASKWEY